LGGGAAAIFRAERRLAIASRQGELIQYAVVIEKSDAGFGAYVPDLPGCVAAAETEDAVRELIREAIGFHLEAMEEDGVPAPVPTTCVEYVDVMRIRHDGTVGEA
jgi:predicted RNase H-like HicB family nuclease